MKFTPMSEEEIAETSTKKEYEVFEPGEYPFEIVTANEGPSKSSQYSRIALNIKIFKPDGSYTWVNDYLSASPAAAFKIRNCSEACGLLDKYNLGEVEAEDFIRRQGVVKVTVEPETAEYAAKNKVVSYVVDKSKRTDKKDAAMKMREPIKEILEDDIPF